VSAGLAAERTLPAGGLDAIVRGDERLGAAARVEIYANMYFFRLLEILREDFPATASVLGETHFHNLVTDYLVAHRPSERSVFWAGREFAAYLRVHPLSAQFPFAADLAAVERALVDVFCAIDAAVLEAAAMQAIAAERWPALRLRTIAALAIVDCEYNVCGILDAVGGSGVSSAPPCERASILVWRRNAQVFYRALDCVEAVAISRLARPTTFGKVCELIATRTMGGDAVGEINRMLSRWLSDGILTLAPPRRTAPDSVRRYA
jgi:Putative DNA-binding domain